MVDLNVEPKIIKHVGENIRFLWYKIMQKFVRYDIKETADFIKIKNYSNAIKRVYKQATDWKKISANHIF